MSWARRSKMEMMRWCNPSAWRRDDIPTRHIERALPDADFNLLQSNCPSCTPSPRLFASIAPFQHTHQGKVSRVRYYDRIVISKRRPKSGVESCRAAADQILQSASSSPRRRLRNRGPGNSVEDLTRLPRSIRLQIQTLTSKEISTETKNN